MAAAWLTSLIQSQLTVDNKHSVLSALFRLLCNGSVAGNEASCILDYIDPDLSLTGDESNIKNRIEADLSVGPSVDLSVYKTFSANDCSLMTPRSIAQSARGGSVGHLCTDRPTDRY